MSVPVLVAVPGTAEATLVAAWEAARRDVVVVRRCADLAEVLAAAQAGLARAAVLGADLPGSDVDTVELLRRHGVGLVVLLPAGAAGEAAERRWRQLGALRLASASDPPEDVARLVTAAVEDLSSTTTTTTTAAGAAVPEDSPAPGRTAVVWGPHGSSGRTTVAVNTAAELARDGAQVLLVDADTRGAGVGQALGLLDEAPGLLAAVRAAADGRLDTATLHRHAPAVLPDLAVLTGSPDPGRWAEVRPAALRRLLAVAAAAFDWVVVDLAGGLDDPQDPRGRDAATVVALEAADAVVHVGAADPVGLQRWVRSWSLLQELAPGTPALPVVSRVRASAVGSPPARRTTSALRRFAGVEDVLLLPEDVAADTALLAGRTLAEVAPRSPLHRAVRQLALRLEERVDAPLDPVEAVVRGGFDPLLARS
ncbi:AAA family ATPase [Kineococcus sp. SYSU DK006]|uniref:AAA family ATPase n=1 Tax=Kineococcus sp. SYSU DK006 TaxID=3383127 RepID=UPI003D7D4709